MRFRAFGSSLGLLAVTVVGCSGADVYEYRRPPGQVIVTPDFVFRTCPRVRYYTVAPIQTGVGGHIALVASAPPVADGGVPNVRWSGPGDIADPDAFKTTYTCTDSGAQQIVLTLTTDDGCQSTEKIDVTCM